MEENNTSIQCKNCGTTIHEKFCAHCGQKTTVQRITIRDTLSDFSDTIFSVDAPLFYTIKMLSLHPGIMLREFLAGKRKRYYKPVAFFVLMTIIYLLVRALIGYDPLLASAIRVTGNPQDLIVQSQHLMFENITKFLFLFVFWFGLLLKTFFYKRYSTVECWTIGFYLVSFYLIFSTLNMFLVQYVSSDLQFLAIVVIGVYFVFALRSLFQTPKWLITLKAIPVYIISITLYVISAFALSFLIVYLKNQ
tara:strand:+ start:5499 stop:6245 length:747 start_codon:yes stop_codon:yes gene_type:complete